MKNITTRLLLLCLAVYFFPFLNNSQAQIIKDSQGNEQVTDAIPVDFKAVLKYPEKTYSDSAQVYGITNEKLISFLHNRNIAFWKVEEFRQLEVDILEMCKNMDGGTDWHSLRNPVIVEGFVVGRSYDPYAKSYHTNLTIKIERILKGEDSLMVTTNELIVNQVSGPIGDEFYRHASDETEFFLGEKVVLFLEPRNGLEGNFICRKKYTTKRNYLYDEYKKIGRVDDVLQRISEVNAVNDSVKNKQ